MKKIFSIARICFLLLICQTIMFSNDTLSLSTGVLIKYSIYGEDSYEIFEDSKNDVWVATQNGVFQFKSNDIVQHTVDDGLGYNYCTTIFEDSNNVLWVGNTNINGLNNFVDGTWTNFVSGNDVPRYVYSMCEGNDGKLYISGRDQNNFDDIFIYDGVNFEQQWLSWGGYGDISIGINGNIYVSAYSYLLEYDYQTWNSYFSSFHSLYNKFQDATGKFWITSAGAGLKTFQENQFSETYTYLNTQGGLASDGCHDIKFKAGEIWVATKRGICSFDGNEWNKRSELNGALETLSDHNIDLNKWINNILFDSQDNLWLSTRDGIYKYIPSIRVSDINIITEVELDIFPNPVINELNINLKGLTDLKVTIYNRLGEKILSEYIKSEEYFSLPLSHLESGLYYILIKNERVAKTFKFVKV